MKMFNKNFRDYKPLTLDSLFFKRSKVSKNFPRAGDKVFDSLRIFVLCLLLRISASDQTDF